VFAQPKLLLPFLPKTNNFITSQHHFIAGLSIASATFIVLPFGARAGKWRQK
jgi:hypothetical protein